MGFQVLHVSALKVRFSHRYHSCAPASRCKASSNFHANIGIRRPVYLSECINSHHVEVIGPMPSYALKRAGKKSVIKCSASEKNHTEVQKSNQLVQLPLFPLRLVLFPGVTHCFQIFEFRHRMMMHTLLQSDLRFGVIYSDNSNVSVDVGCVVEMVKLERLVDDRYYVLCKGQERFRIINFVRTKPYLVAEVQWLEDRPCTNGHQDLNSLALEVESCLKDVIRLSKKLNTKPELETKDLPRNLFPTPFSFFVGSNFVSAPREQQALLELEDTALRLKREKETLRNALKYLAAVSAVKDAFQFSSFNEN
ncbi:lon protease 2-like [Cocos nucifera]|uniref:Lon protease 2-like n=1 Tax=Cocos nucifera TaxID=13894 RepID=A0A8K0IHZ9_COCNU|nr:lon protease 2-like [Cocos nucifera]